MPLDSFPAFYGTWRFTTKFTRALHLSLSWARQIQSTAPHPLHMKNASKFKSCILTLSALWDLRCSQKWLWRAETYKLNQHTVRQTIQSWVPPILKTKTTEAGAFLPEHMVSWPRIFECIKFIIPWLVPHHTTRIHGMHITYLILSA
jgi:hypothetical protein